jgi:hypothetical protein
VVFSVVGPLCRVDKEEDRLLLLAWLNSRPVRWVIESTAPAGEETKKGGTAARHYTVGGVQRMPWIGPSLEPTSARRIAALAEEIVQARASFDDTDETTRRFVLPSAVMHPGLRLRDRAESSVATAQANALAVLDKHREIDEVFLDALDVTPGPELDESVGPSIGALPDRPLSAEEETRFVDLYHKSVSEIIDAATETVGMARHVRLNYYLIDRRLELLAITFNRHPRQLASVRDARRLLPPDEPLGAANGLLSYLVGVAFGRWDVRLSQDSGKVPASPGLSEPLRICPPGMLLDPDGLPAVNAPAGYPIALPNNGILVDEPGHQWDVEGAIYKAAAVCLDDPITLVTEMLEIVEGKSVRDHLRRQFFKDHLARYSKSRRKAPIYWHLSVPSKGWGVWLYAPALTRETLYVVASEAARRERLGAEAMTRLQREQQQGGAGRSPKKVALELDAEEKLSEELRRFRAEAERVAGLGWEPDLDDGLVLCSAPLANLFPLWPEAKATRTLLRDGEYEWATVARWSSQL